MYKQSAYQLRSSLLNGDLKARQIAEFFLKRAHKSNEKTKSFLNFLDEKALKKAEDIDKKIAEKKPLGKLAGVPIAIKDNLNIQGEKTTCASNFLKNYVAPYSATVIDLLEREDAILIGKTNLDEFAMGSSTETSAFQKTYNPWNLDYTPGGSSGGSASAVSAREALISLGSDTGGSIRQPAAYCGIVGFKPTYGRVSRYGLVAFGSSLDQIGPFASNVEDIAMTMEVLGRHCPNDSTSYNKTAEPYLDEIKASISGKTIGVPWHFIDNLTPPLKALFENSLEKFKALGVNIIEINLEDLKFSIPTYYIIAPAEASTNLARFDGIQFSQRSSEASNLEQVYTYSRRDGFGPEVKQRILLGTFVLSSGFKDAYYKKALRVRELIINEYQRAFSKCDIVAMPTTPTSAFKLGSIGDPVEMYMQDLYSISANLAGLPAISVPSGFDDSGMPFGLQLIGPQLEDARVLRFAHQYQTQDPSAFKIPPLFDKEDL